jgi:hypothetical protein
MKTRNWIPGVIYLACLLSIVSSCKPYMHLRYGLTQPQEETPEEIMSFLKKHDFPTENQYAFFDTGSYCQAIKDPKFSKYLLGTLIFDRQGYLLQRDTIKCQWAGYDVIKSLNPDSLYVRSMDLQMSGILPSIKPLSIDTTADEIKNNPDFTVIITWAKFIGTYNHRLFDLAGAVNLNKICRIRLIWLNVDMQKSWHLTDSQKMKIK